MNASNLATQETGDSDRVCQIFDLLAIVYRSELALAKVTNLATQALPRQDDAHVIPCDLTQGNVRQLIALMHVPVKS